MTHYPARECFRHRLPKALCRKAYVLGLISAFGVTGAEDGCWRVCYVGWRSARPYVLGLKRERWGYPWHFLRTGHWPRPVWAGLCGICAPWPCCGATGYDHADDCEEEF